MKMFIKRALAAVLVIVMLVSATPLNSFIDLIDFSIDASAASYSVGEAVYFAGGYLWGSIGVESTKVYKKAKVLYVTDPSYSYGGKTYIGLRYETTAGRYGWAESSLVSKLNYTVTFNANGGSCSTGSKTVKYQSTYGTLPTPTRTGYNFAGWFTSASGGTQITASSTYTSKSNQTLYAHWTAKTFTVSFNANGGSCSTSNKTVTYNSTYGTLPTPTRTGYQFKGWYTSTSGGTNITSSSKVSITAAQTLYAQWTAKTFTVSFNANGGSCSTSNKTVTYNSTYGTLPTPTRTGYQFKGWYTSTSGGTNITSSSKVSITAAQTLYAQWTGSPCLVTFNANGGSCSTSSKSVTYGQTYGTLPKATRTNYDFDGWFTAATGGQQITALSNVNVYGSQTLYAQWTYLIHKVSYNANGGSNAPANQEYNQNDGITLTKSVPTKKYTLSFNATGGVVESPTKDVNCTFRSWNTKSDGSGQSYASGVFFSSYEDITFFAQWDNNAAGDLPTPTRDRYYFAGWYTAETGGTQITSSTVITKSMTLYAHWKSVPTYVLKYNANTGINAPGDQTIYENEPLIIDSAIPEKTYVITFDANGGSVPSANKKVDCSFKYWETNQTGSGDIYYPSSVFDKYKDTTLFAKWDDPKAGTLPRAELFGYRFIGWFTSKTDGLLVTENTVITDDTVLYAHWSLLPTYAISFDNNGGFGEIENLVKTEDVALVLPQEIPVKNITVIYDGNGGIVSDYDKTVNCTFECWKDSVGEDYYPGNNYLKNREDTLTAQWKSSPVGELEKANREGYQFDGWYTDPIGGKAVNSETVFDDDCTLYAHWTPNQYTVSFYDEKTLLGTKLLTYDQVSELTYGTIPDKLGYGFVGWSEENGGNSKYLDGQNVVNLTSDNNKEISLYAVWHKYVLLNDLTYSFGNNHKAFEYADDYKIPLKSYQYIFGKNTLASSFYYREKVNNRLWGGNCYGMSSTATMFNSDSSGTSTFDYNETAFYVSDLSIYDRSETFNISLTEYLEAMQVSQKSTIIQNDYKNNKNNLNELCEFVLSSKNVNQLPIVALFGPEGGHAVVGYDVKKVNNEESRLYVYDCNFPEQERYITVTTDKSGEYVGWYYNLNDKYDWGSEFEDCWISFVPYQDFEFCWKNKGDGKALSQENINVVTTNSMNFEIRDVEGKVVCKVSNGEVQSFNSDIFELVTTELNNFGDTLDSDISIMLPTELYTLTNYDNKIDDFEVYMVNMDLGAIVNTTSDEVTLGVDDSFDLNLVNIETEINDSYEITLLSSMENGYENIYLEGTSDGTCITISESNGELSYGFNNSVDVSLIVDGKLQHFNTTKVIESVEIFEVPSKTEYQYKSSNSIDKSGLKLVVKYSDYSSEIIEDVSKFSCSGLDTNVTGNQTISVEYEGFVTQYNVRVSYSWWQWIIVICLLGFLWY